MHTILKRHQEELLLVLGSLFLAGLVFLYIIVIGSILRATNDATRSNAEVQRSTAFDIEGVQKLNLKGYKAQVAP